jgi:shikimate kinase
MLIYRRRFLVKRISGKNLVLVGFMGTGKTEVGRLLADLLNRRFLDTDRLIVEREGMAISDIFRTRGEVYFRMLERDVVEEVTGRRGLVLSTGGGVVKDVHNVARLRESGFVVWLDADVEALRERLKNDGTRPLLAGDVDLSVLYGNRVRFYREASHARVDTGGKAPLVVVEEIMALIHKEDEKKSY